MKNKKIVRNMIIICLIFLLILLAIIRYIKIYNVRDEEIEKESDVFSDLAQQEYSVGKIVPQNYTTIMREYEGEVKVESWYEMIYKFVNSYIPKIQSAKKLKPYYDSNLTDIKKDLGIISYEDFELLANEIKKVKKDSKFKDSEFDVTTMNITDDYISVDFCIYFYGNQQIDLIFTAYNKINDDISIGIFAK